MDGVVEYHDGQKKNETAGTNRVAVEADWLRPWKKCKDMTFWDRIRLAWQAFRYGRELPYALITHFDVTLNIPHGVRPSQFEEGLNRSCQCYIRVIDHKGKSHQVRIYPFRPY